jgi:hypothetical protein
MDRDRWCDYFSDELIKLHVQVLEVDPAREAKHGFCRVSFAPAARFATARPMYPSPVASRYRLALRATLPEAMGATHAPCCKQQFAFATSASAQEVDRAAQIFLRFRARPRSRGCINVLHPIQSGRRIDRHRRTKRTVLR